MWRAVIHKLAGVFWVSILFVFMFAGLVFASEIDIYGNFSSNISYLKSNDRYQIGSPADFNDLGTYLGGDLYIQNQTSDLFRYFLDLKFDGSFQRQTSQEQMNLSINQFYIVVPFSEKSFLYCGKKYKEIGVSNFFNVSNRISPKYFNNYSYVRNTSGLIEYDILQSDSFDYGFIANFQEARNWDEIQVSAFTNSRFNNFTTEGYLYYDKSRDYSLGLDMSYQLGKYQVYSELIYKQQANQPVILSDTGDLAADFGIRDLENTMEIVLGGSVSVNNFVASLEYLYRNEGYNQDEQSAFIDYLGTHPSAVSELSKLYSYCSLLKNYFAFNISQSSFLFKDLSVNLSGIASYQPDTDNNGDYSSYELTASLNYALSQNLGLTLYQIFRGGGNKGEFVQLYPCGYNCAFIINYVF